MIDPNIAWELVRQNAIKAMKTNMVFRSLVKRKQYRVVRVTDNFVKIMRVKQKTVSRLSKANFLAAIETLSDNHSKVKRGSLLQPVAKETTLVLFCNIMGWSSKGKISNLLNDNQIVDIEFGIFAVPVSKV